VKLGDQVKKSFPLFTFPRQGEKGHLPETRKKILENKGPAMYDKSLFRHLKFPQIDSTPLPSGTVVPAAICIRAAEKHP